MKQWRDLNRIGKNIRLSDDSLRKADKNGLIRLAAFLGVLPRLSNIRSEKEWIQNIRVAIAREEKNIFKRPKEERFVERETKMDTILVKKLRDLTNAPMSECITALNETGKDFDKAVDWLKVRGIKSDSSSKEVSELKEGRIAVFEGSVVTMVQINCQTDFAANSDLLKDSLEDITTSAGLSVKDWEQNLSFKLKESVKIKMHTEFCGPAKTGDSPNGLWNEIGSYVHSNGKIGVLLMINMIPPESRTIDAAKYTLFKENLCMQIAATNCLAIYPEDLPKELVDRQKTIFEQQVIALKKSEMASAKILEGKMNGWYAEVCLMNQGCIWQPKLQVAKYVNDFKSECGHPVTLKHFVKFTV